MKRIISYLCLMMLLTPNLTFSKNIYWFDFLGFDYGIGYTSESNSIINGVSAIKINYIDKKTRFGAGLGMMQFYDNLNDSNESTYVTLPIYVYYLLNKDINKAKTNPFYMYFGGGYAEHSLNYSPNTRLLELGITKSYNDFIDFRLGYIKLSADAYDSIEEDSPSKHFDPLNYEGIQIGVNFHFAFRWGVPQGKEIKIKLKNEKVVTNNNFYIDGIIDSRIKQEDIGHSWLGYTFNVPIVFEGGLEKSLLDYYQYSLPKTENKTPVYVNILDFRAGQASMQGKLSGQGGVELSVNYFVRDNDKIANVFTSSVTAKATKLGLLILTRKQKSNYYEERVRTAINTSLISFSSYNWTMDDLVFQDSVTYQNNISSGIQTEISLSEALRKSRQEYRDYRAQHPLYGPADTTKMPEEVANKNYRVKHLSRGLSYIYWGGAIAYCNPISFEPNLLAGILGGLYVYGGSRLTYKALAQDGDKLWNFDIERKGLFTSLQYRLKYFQFNNNDTLNISGLTYAMGVIMSRKIEMSIGFGKGYYKLNCINNPKPLLDYKKNQLGQIDSIDSNNTEIWSYDFMYKNKLFKKIDISLGFDSDVYNLRDTYTHITNASDASIPITLGKYFQRNNLSYGVKLGYRYTYNYISGNEIPSISLFSSSSNSILLEFQNSKYSINIEKIFGNKDSTLFNINYKY